ncbi:dihydrofolate reductase family protein, partial [Rhizobium johnstonii]|uniref:dihydrofolate reductase family protein n=1 Tax=Rhizobium johnstonii TaxID=3019933 RepID=UPI003F9C1B02
HDELKSSSWENTVPLVGEASETVAQLVASDGPDLSILGSGELVRELANFSLIDEYVLLIHPLVLGTGIRLFGPDLMKLELTSSVTTTKGVT